jgi:APA family basic amino acid/polyamine antiporter
MPGKDTISLPSAVSLVVTSMIGVGVFTSVGFQLVDLPSGFPIIMLWVAGGIVSLCGALCYSELVAMLPRSGGEYHILREAYHPVAGFLAGWISVTAGFAAPIAGISMVFGKYVHTLGFTVVEANSTAAALVLIITLIHFGTLRFTGGFLTLMTALKVLLILAFLAGAVFARPGGPSLAPKAGDLAMIGSAEFASSLVFVMFAYLGWNGAAYVAGEVRNPQRAVPLAFLIGIIFVMALYIGLNAVFLRTTPWESMRGELDAGLVAARAIFGERGGWIMGALISFGIISTVAGFTWSGSRVAQRMGQDFRGLGFLAAVNANGAPVLALTAQAALALVMLFSGTFDQVINYLMSQLILCSMLAVVAVAVLRRTRPDAPRPFRLPWYPVPVTVFVLMSVWMLRAQTLRYPEESAWGYVTLLAGAAVYVFINLAGPAKNDQSRGESAK